MVTQYLDLVLYAVAMIAILVIFLPFSPMTIDIVNFRRDTQLKIYLNRYILWAIGTMCFAVLLTRAIMGSADQVWLTTALISIGMLVFMFWSGYVPFIMTPPSNPSILTLEEADKVISQDEVVIGLVHGGEVRAYSRDAIARPHFYSDAVGGTPVTVSYCILCNSGMAFKNEINDKPMDLGCACGRSRLPHGRPILSRRGSDSLHYFLIPQFRLSSGRFKASSGRFRLWP